MFMLCGFRKLYAHTVFGILCCLFVDLCVFNFLLIFSFSNKAFHVQQTHWLFRKLPMTNTIMVSKVRSHISSSLGWLLDTIILMVLLHIITIIILIFCENQALLYCHINNTLVHLLCCMYVLYVFLYIKSENMCYYFICIYLQWLHSYVLKIYYITFYECVLIVTLFLQCPIVHTCHGSVTDIGHRHLIKMLIH